MQKDVPEDMLNDLLNGIQEDFSGGNCGVKDTKDGICPVKSRPWCPSHR